MRVEAGVPYLAAPAAGSHGAEWRTASVKTASGRTKDGCWWSSMALHSRTRVSWPQQEEPGGGAGTAGAREQGQQKPCKLAWEGARQGADARRQAAAKRHAQLPRIRAGRLRARPPTWDACSAEDSSINFTTTVSPHQRPAGSRRRGLRLYCACAL